jgi:hypothetical protein
MKKLAIVLAVGAAALLGGSTAHAADNAVKVRALTDVSQSTQPNGMSARRRHVRYQRIYHGYYRPNYGYAPQAYYAPQPYYYGGGGPVLSFGFGGGGYRGGGWGHHRGW